MKAARRPGLESGVLGQAALLGASVLLAAGLGAAVGRSEAVTAVMATALSLLVIAVAALAAGRIGRESLVGLTAGVLILGAMNALPGPDLEAIPLVGGTVQLEDGCTLALIGVLAWAYPWRSGVTPHDVYARAARAACLLLALWWLFTLLRSWVAGDVSLPRAAFFGRDLLYLAVIFPLAMPLVRSVDSRRALIAVLAAGAAIAAVGQGLVSLGAPLPGLVHVSDLGRDSGLVRVHSPASALVAASIPFAVGAVLFSSGSMRLLAAAVACVSSVSIALQLTRALYFGLIIGLALAIVVWVLLAPGAAVGRRRLWRITATAAIAVAAVASYQPSSTAGDALNGVRTRFLSGVEEFTRPQTRRSTLAYRGRERRAYARALSGHQLAGLGFLPPAALSVPGLPGWTGGSIRNSDVGVYNVLMTMGIVGVVIYSLPFLLALAANIATRERVRSADRWLAFGCLAWLFMAIVTSWNLVVLFSPPGVVLSAFILAITFATSEGSAGSRG